MKVVKGNLPRSFSVRSTCQFLSVHSIIQTYRTGSQPKMFNRWSRSFLFTSSLYRTTNRVIHKFCRTTVVCCGSAKFVGDSIGGAVKRGENKNDWDHLLNSLTPVHLCPIHASMSVHVHLVTYWNENFILVSSFTMCQQNCNRKLYFVPSLP